MYGDIWLYNPYVCEHACVCTDVRALGAAWCVCVCVCDTNGGLKSSKC